MRTLVGRAVVFLGFMAAAAGIIWSLLPRPVPVETAAVNKGRFVATVDEDGKTRIRERYVVAAPLAGLLVRISLKVGDRVAAKEVVATIAPSPAPFLDLRSRREAEQRLGAAEAEGDRAKALVERARAQAAQATTELQRIRTLVERGASTTQALERAELAMRVADRDLRAAEFQDHVAEHQLDQTRALLARYHDSAEAPPERWNVTAPVAGVVLKVAQESEAVVQAGTPLLEIGDPRDLEVVIDVLSADAVEIQPGTDVVIEHWGGPSALTGRVRKVEPAAFTKVSTLGVEEQRVNVLVDLLSSPDEWKGLGGGFRVDARIIVYTRDDAIIIPAGALFRIGEGWHVYVVRNGRAQAQAVEVLRRSGRIAAIGAGLGPEEQVIVYPSDRIENGVRVEPR